MYIPGIWGEIVDANLIDWMDVIDVVTTTARLIFVDGNDDNNNDNGSDSDRNDDTSAQLLHFPAAT